VIVATTAEVAGEESVLNTTEPETLVLPGESGTFSGSTPAPGPAETSGIAELPKNCDPENAPALSPPEESASTPFPMAEYRRSCNARRKTNIVPAVEITLNRNADTVDTIIVLTLASRAAKIKPIITPVTGKR
jgi:hypothetical protein